MELFDYIKKDILNLKLMNLKIIHNSVWNKLLLEIYFEQNYFDIKL
jgi:hypothetical protein